MSGNTANDLSKLEIRVNFLEEKIIDSLEDVKENQKHISSQISMVKSAVYDPDTGLYARLRTVEDARKAQSRFIWLIVSALIGTIGAVIGSVIQ
jgi:hypothetical protein